MTSSSNSSGRALWIGWVSAMSDIAKINPRVIYCSISGYGQTGPKREVAGHDINYMGDSGLLALSLGTAAEHPVLPPALIADIAGGTYPAVLNILLALKRSRPHGTRHASRHHDGRRRVSIHLLGDGARPGRRTMVERRRRLRHRRQREVQALSHGRRKVRCGGRVGAEVLVGVHVQRSGWMPHLIDDAVDTVVTADRIREIIISADFGTTGGRSWPRPIAVARSWRPCRRPWPIRIFKARGLFSETLANEAGDTMVALPVPIAPQFRPALGETRAASPLGADHNADLET